MTQATPAHVPATVQDMLPPKAADLNTEAANFLRAHWDEVKRYYQSISGETPSMHGASDLDEAACVFEIKRIAGLNGFALLGSVPTVKLRKALRYGYRRNTGHAVSALVKQQIEHRQQQ